MPRGIEGEHPVLPGDATMRGWILDTPQHLRAALAQARTQDWLPSASTARAIFLAGMGGSGMACQLARALLWDRSSVPCVVQQDPEVPSWLGKGDLAIVVSYSGNTWEAVHLFEECRARGARAAAVTSGGRMQALCETHQEPCFQVPAGMAPRAALSWMTVPVVLAAAGALRPSAADDLEAAASEIAVEVEEWRRGRALVGRDARELAARTLHRTVLIYAPSERLRPVARRWKSQLEENAEQWASESALPELVHNEIMGWRFLRENTSATILVLEDQEAGGPADRDLRAMVARAALGEMSAEGLEVIRVPPRGTGATARLLSHLLLADLTSVELARLRGIDPLPVTAIERLKASCGKERSG